MSYEETKKWFGGLDQLQRAAVLTGGAVGLVVVLPILLGLISGDLGGFVFFINLLLAGVGAIVYNCLSGDDKKCSCCTGKCKEKPKSKPKSKDDDDSGLVVAGSAMLAGGLVE